MNDDDRIDIDPVKVLAIIREENPQAYELAIRRAVIDHQREVINLLHAATLPADEVLA